MQAEGMPKGTDQKIFLKIARLLSLEEVEGD
jgi:hypothetical protein